MRLHACLVVLECKFWQCLWNASTIIWVHNRLQLSYDCIRIWVSCLLTYQANSILATSLKRRTSNIAQLMYCSLLWLMLLVGNPIQRKCDFSTWNPDMDSGCLILWWAKVRRLNTSGYSYTYPDLFVIGATILCFLFWFICSIYRHQTSPLVTWPRFTKFYWLIKATVYHCGDYSLPTSIVCWRIQNITGYLRCEVRPRIRMIGVYF